MNINKKIYNTININKRKNPQLFFFFFCAISVSNKQPLKGVNFIISNISDLTLYTIEIELIYFINATDNIVTKYPYLR